MPRHIRKCPGGPPSAPPQPFEFLGFGYWSAGALRGCTQRLLMHFELGLVRAPGQLDGVLCPTCSPRAAEPLLFPVGSRPLHSSSALTAGIKGYLYPMPSRLSRGQACDSALGSFKSSGNIGRHRRNCVCPCVGEETEAWRWPPVWLPVTDDVTGLTVSKKVSIFLCQ